jgi:aspartyl-tRNA(Asn)/glutamyl-tRNA(Gln) amidotransferase subunit A
LFEYTSIDQYHLALTQGKISCSEIVHHYLSEIEKCKQLNAFVHVFAEEAIQKATALDERRRSGNTTGKLHGVVIAIKDVICYKDHPLTAASGILKNFTSL